MRSATARIVSPRFRRAVARSLPNLISDRLTAGGKTSDTLDLIFKAPYIKPYNHIWSNILDFIKYVQPHEFNRYRLACRYLPRHAGDGNPAQLRVRYEI